MLSFPQAFCFQPSARIILFNPRRSLKRSWFYYTQFTSKEIEALVNLLPTAYLLKCQEGEVNTGCTWPRSLCVQSLCDIASWRSMTYIPHERGRRTQLPAEHGRTGVPSCRDGAHLSQAPHLLRSTCPNDWNPWDMTEWEGSLSIGLVPINDNSHLDLLLTVLFWVGSFTPWLFRNSSPYPTDSPKWQRTDTL